MSRCSVLNLDTPSHRPSMSHRLGIAINVPCHKPISCTYKILQAELAGLMYPTHTMPPLKRRLGSRSASPPQDVRAKRPTFGKSAGRSRWFWQRPVKAILSAKDGEKCSLLCRVMSRAVRRAEFCCLGLGHLRCTVDPPLHACVRRDSDCFCASRWVYMWLNCLELCVLCITSYLSVNHCRHSFHLALARVSSL